MSETNADFRILIVDDTPANLYALSKLLAGQGYRVQVARSGPRALEVAQASPPDLILLDVVMPDMNGYRVCQQLKADELTRDIPIIFLSALDATEDKVQAFTAGGVDYITKPFQVEEVLHRIETHLSLGHLQKQLQVANITLQQKVEQLETRNRDLDAFAHTLAHDLKHSLGIITLFLNLLDDDVDLIEPEQVRSEVQRAIRHAYKMDDIIASLLLLATVSQQDMELAPLDMAGIVAEAQTRLSVMMETYHPELTLPEQWPVAWGYAPWVEEVWVNYLSNAFKYGSRPGEDVPLRVELGFTGGEQPQIKFWVRDNGPGLSPEEQSQLFTPFTRIRKTSAEGHGLGLSIVQRIVDKLGGQVDMESTEGQGSVFYFSLPAYTDQA